MRSYAFLNVKNRKDKSFFILAPNLRVVIVSLIPICILLAYMDFVGAQVILYSTRLKERGL